MSNPHNLRGILRRLSVDSPELQVNEPRTLQYILQTLNDTSMMALEGLNLENLDLLQDTGARIESLMTMYPMVGPTKSDAKLSTTNGAVDTDSVFAHLLSSTGRVTSTES